MKDRGEIQASIFSSINYSLDRKFPIPVEVTMHFGSIFGVPFSPTRKKVKTNRNTKVYSEKVGKKS